MVSEPCSLSPVLGGRKGKRMRVVLNLLFGLLLALELVVLLVVTGVIVNGAVYGWRERPGTTAALALVLLLSGIGLWRSHVMTPASPPESSVMHPGINFSRVPATGAGGAIFMLQFVVWLVVAPAVGVLYAVLIAGGLALVPVAWRLNRRRGGAAGVSGGAILGVVAAALCASIIPFRHTPLAWVLPFAVPAGVVGAGVLVWRRSSEERPSIAPYAK